MGRSKKPTAAELKKIRLVKMIQEVTSSGSSKDTWNPAEISEGLKNINFIRRLVDTWNPAQLNEAIRRLGFKTIDTWNPAIIDEMKTALIRIFALHSVTGNPITLNLTGELPYLIKEATATFSPKQSGTGDPSPTNIRPISGWDGLNLTRTGKNLFNPTPYLSYIQSDGRYKLTGTQSVAIAINIPSYLVGKQLTFSAYLDLSEGSTPTNCKCLATVNGTNIIGNAIDSGNKGISSVTFTPLSTNDSFRITYGSNPSNYFYFSNPQLELGSTATTYEPYQGETYPATFDETVYGGIYDFVSGEGQSKVAIVTFDGTENWTYSSSGGGRYQIVSVGLPANSQVACNILKAVNEQATGNVYISNSGNLLCYVADASAENLTAWTTYLSETNMELAYELSTPTPIELTGQEVEPLPGVNVFSTDADTLNIKYQIDLS